MIISDTPTPPRQTVAGETPANFDDLIYPAQERDGSYRYSNRAAYLLSVASGWAYSTESTFRDVMSRMGVSDASCRYINVENDAMLVAATAYFVRSKDGKLGFLCFRGTEPRNVINWLTDASVSNVPFQQYGEVHGGFFRNVQALWPQLTEKLIEASAGANKLEALYITGHSLGAAMAALAAMIVWFDPALMPMRKALRGVYTFGQPMVAVPDLARACDGDLGKIVFRHVYGHDIVPRMPPRSTGIWTHFGNELRSTEEHWRVRAKPIAQAQTAILSVPIGVAAWVCKQLPLLHGLNLPFSWDDHSPVHYMECSKLAPGSELSGTTQALWRAGATASTDGAPRSSENGARPPAEATAAR